MAVCLEIECIFCIFLTLFLHHHLNNRLLYKFSVHTGYWCEYGALITLYPAGTWRKNDVVLPPMRRDYVASTSIRRHFGSRFPLGNPSGPDEKSLRLLFLTFIKDKLCDTS